MAKFMPRSVTFTIPAAKGIGVQVTATENDNGNLDFSVDVLKNAVDLRGFFFHFDEFTFDTLQVRGGDGLITKTQVLADGVINLGGGISFIGTDAHPFDVGIAFRAGAGNAGPVHFTLDAAQPLTLDDIANVEFGAQLSNGEKLTFRAPAAPDANDDRAATHEDKAVVIQVLANDTDAESNGDVLKVTSVSLGADSHGTAVISADGKSIIYTPDKDFAGTNVNARSVDATLQYSISDTHGGKDSATVNVHVTPVADKPAVSFEVLKPHDDDAINVVRLKVTATASDTDGSEFIDRIAFDSVPAGWTLTTDGNLKTTNQPGTATEEVKLVLPTGADLSFDFKATAYAQEKGIGDPDEASGSASQHIGVEFNHSATQENFLAQHQSIWGSGNASSISKSAYFPLVDEFFDIDLIVNGRFKVGFTDDILLQGGEINAHLPVNVTVDSTYNTTTDALLVHTESLLASGGGFTTTGPEGHYNLGFLVNILIDAGILSDGEQTYDATLSAFPGAVPSPFGSEHGPLTTSFGQSQLKLEWPHLTVSSETQTGNEISGDNASNNFVEFDADIDDLVLQLASGGSFGAVSAALVALMNFIGPDHEDLEGSFQILDVDVTAGINLIEQFVLKLLNVQGTLVFENGTQSNLFTLGQDIVIHDAKNLDANKDGKIEFGLVLKPNATLDNNISIGFNGAGDLYVGKNNGLGIDPLHITLFDEPIAAIPIDDGGPFALAFSSQTWNLIT